MNLQEKENIEINYWKDSAYESPDMFTVGNYLNKMQECKNLEYRINKYKKHILGKRSVLEIGAGQGWASCFMKKYYLADAKFTVTDISPYAIKSIVEWEKEFGISIDRSFASKSYEIDAGDKSFDLIFCYASAHHFVLFEKTLEELRRVLSDDGCIFFFYEPTCSALFYPLHYWYVNKAPHVTPEDVIVPSKIRDICLKLNMNYMNHYEPRQIIIRSIPLAIYFSILKLFPFLNKILPSSSDLYFEKTDQ